MGEGKSVMGQRVLYGALGVCFLILMFYIGGWFFDLSLIIVALIGTKELYSALTNKGFKPQTWAGYALIFLFYLQHIFLDGVYDFIYSIIAVVFLLSLLIWKQSIKPVDIAVTILGFFYPGIFLITAILLREQAYIHEYYLLILTLTATFATDTFAYFIGIRFGKNKLCPSISPGKTIEGSLGGMIGSIFSVILIGIILGRVYNTHLSVVHQIAIGLLGGVFSQIGDLTASAIKRYCGIKDYGNIMPGHGGILDRIDSLLFTLPIVYFYYLIFLA